MASVKNHLFLLILKFLNMPKLKVLGGKELIKIFTEYGFEKIDQRGSHVKIRRIGPDGRETLTIPMHSEIEKGLLKQILYRLRDIFLRIVYEYIFSIKSSRNIFYLLLL
jgi:predicted RNA binding protein YcfA (HicA-like mRNA interferase family)